MWLALVAGVQSAIDIKEEDAVGVFRRRTPFAFYVDFALTGLEFLLPLHLARRQIGPGL